MARLPPGASTYAEHRQQEPLFGRTLPGSELGSHVLLAEFSELLRDGLLELVQRESELVVELKNLHDRRDPVADWRKYPLEVEIVGRERDVPESRLVGTIEPGFRKGDERRGIERGVFRLENAFVVLGAEESPVIGRRHKTARLVVFAPELVKIESSYDTVVNRTHANAALFVPLPFPLDLPEPVELRIPVDFLDRQRVAEAEFERHLAVESHLGVGELVAQGIEPAGFAPVAVLVVTGEPRIPSYEVSDVLDGEFQLRRRGNWRRLRVVHLVRDAGGPLPFDDGSEPCGFPARGEFFDLAFFPEGSRGARGRG